MNLTCRALVPGSASGPVLAIAPLSFWGGYDPVSGLVTDRSHPNFGQSLAGKILVMSTGRGSSSSSSVLAEALRLGTGPAAIILSEPDAILATGAIVAETLYGRSCAIILAPRELHVLLASADTAEVAVSADTARIVLR